MAGHQPLGAEGLQAIEDFEPSGHRALDGEGGSSVEDEIAGEHHPVVGEVGHDVVGGVSRPAEVDQLDASLPGPYRETVLEGDHGGPHLEVTPVRSLEEGGDRGAGQLGLEAATVMTDDRGAGREQVIAERMVTVVVRVDQGLDRFASTDPAGSVQQGPTPVLGAGLVDHDDGFGADDDAGVVEEPAPVRLDVGEHAVGHLLNDGLGHLVHRRHGIAPWSMPSLRTASAIEPVTPRS